MSVSKNVTAPVGTGPTNRKSPTPPQPPPTGIASSRLLRPHRANRFRHPQPPSVSVSYRETTIAQPNPPRLCPYLSTV
jgi:hypothetical protein